jgi:CHAT domain-containing protein
MNKMRWLLVCFLILSISGCLGLSKTIEISSLAQKKQHYEIIRVLQKDVDDKKEVSSFLLFILSGAYYEIRDYANMFTTVDLLDRKIAQGDASMYGSDLTEYPGILRGYAYLDLGEYDKAVRAASAAYTLLGRTDQRSNNFYRSQLIDIAGILGVAHAHLDHDAESDRWLAVLQRIDTRETIIGPEKFIAIARIYMARKQYQQALIAIQDPEAKVTGPATAFYDQTFQELPKFFILTKALYETGRVREAKEGYDRLLKHPQIKQIGGMYWPVLLDRATIARKEGQLALAEKLLREAVDVIEKQRASITTEAGRIGYVGDKQAVYQELVALLVNAGRPAEAFEYVERAKGRALVDLLASQKNITIHGKDAEQAKTTFRKLASAEKEMSVVGGPGSAQDRSHTRGIALVLKKDLASETPEFTSLVAVSGVSLREIQDRLSEDETLVEYYGADRVWFVFVVKRGSVLVKKLGDFDLAQVVRKFRKSLTDPASNDYVRYSRECYRELILPIAGSLTTEKLTIVPHGALHYLPFGALSSGKEYLVDRMDIRVLQTAGILKFLTHRTRERDPRALVMGNPDLGDPRYDLKYAQKEAQAIAALLPHATLLLRDKAKAAFIYKNAGRFSIIHFAVHGVFDPEDPLDSALLFAGDKDRDGWLRASDLYNLNLHADLVTLSACETALGKITGGDDVVGFTRGLLYAGAGTIVSTLWNVDDQATEDLMVDFYSKLITMGKGEALRQAQLDTKKKYPHPFYWASFQLTGNQ